MFLQIKNQMDKQTFIQLEWIKKGVSITIF